MLYPDMSADVLAFHERLTVCVDAAVPVTVSVVREDTPAQPISSAVAARLRIFRLLSSKEVRRFMSECLPSEEIIQYCMASWWLALNRLSAFCLTGCQQM